MCKSNLKKLQCSIAASLTVGTFCKFVEDGTSTMCPSFPRATAIVCFRQQKFRLYAWKAAGPLSYHVGGTAVHPRPLKPTKTRTRKRAKMTIEHVFFCNTLSISHQPRSTLLKSIDNLKIQLKFVDGVSQNDSSLRRKAATEESFDSGMFDLGWIKPKPKKFSKSTLLWLIGSLVALVAVAAWGCL